MLKEETDLRRAERFAWVERVLRARRLNPEMNAAALSARCGGSKQTIAKVIRGTWRSR